GVPAPARAPAGRAAGRAVPRDGLLLPRPRSGRASPPVPLLPATGTAGGGVAVDRTRGPGDHATGHLARDRAGPPGHVRRGGLPRPVGLIRPGTRAPGVRDQPPSRRW